LIVTTADFRIVGHQPPYPKQEECRHATNSRTANAGQPVVGPRHVSFGQLGQQPPGVQSLPTQRHLLSRRSQPQTWASLPFPQPGPPAQWGYPGPLVWRTLARRAPAFARCVELLDPLQGLPPLEEPTEDAQDLVLLSTRAPWALAIDS